MKSIQSFFDRSCVSRKGKYDIFKYWFISMQDRAYTNQSDIMFFREEPIGASLSQEGFCSHTLNNRMKTLLEKGNIMFATKFRKLYQLIIQ